MAKKPQGLDLWTVHSPLAGMSFDGRHDAVRALEVELGQLPGVKPWRDRKGSGSAWNVPLNAVQVVAELVERFGVSVSHARWSIPIPGAVTWAAVEAELRERGEVREFVFDFLTEYQKGAITYGWNRTGTHFWMPTGSGKTLVSLITALSSPGLVLIITRAAARLQLAREVERFLNIRPYVVRPVSNPGPVRILGETWHMFRARHKGQGLSPTRMGELWEAHKAEHGPDGYVSMQAYVKRCRTAGELEQLASTAAGGDIPGRHRPVVVLGWEALTDHLEALVGMRPSVVIFDETHYRMRNHKRFDVVHLPELPDDPREAGAIARQQELEAKTKGGFLKVTEDGRKAFIPVTSVSSAGARLARVVQKRIALSATPLANRVRDLWAQLDLVEPNAWGNASKWLDRYAGRKPGVYGGFDTTGASNLEELKQRIDTCAHILRYHETHRHLPPKRRQSAYIAPEDQVQPLGGFTKELADAKKRGPTALLEVHLAIAASKKRKAVLGYISDHMGSNQKVVVFTGRRRDCDELGDLVRKLPEAKVDGATVWAAHGEVNTDVRQKIVDEFMAHPGPCCLVATGQSFGESLNLDTCDAAMFVMLPYTPAELRQWEGRFHRASTKKPVLIYYVIAEGTADEHVAEILISKLPAVAAMVEDKELAEAKGILAGFDENMTAEEFARGVLAAIDRG